MVVLATLVVVAMSGVKETAADKYFSLCVRERTGWKCERCGKQYGPGIGVRSGLDCSHFYTRGNWSVRFEPLNAFAHCYGCHAYLEGNPREFERWVRDRLGAECYDVLVELAERSPMRGKQYKRESRDVSAHYRHELEKMMIQRVQGVKGRIEFEAYV